MIDELVEAVLEKHRRNEIPGNIAAIFDCDTRPNDLDGLRWRLYVTDGLRVETVEAGLSGSAGGALGRTVDTHLLEAAVERRAANAFPIESRMDDLVAASPIALRAEDLRPHRKLPAGFL